MTRYLAIAALVCAACGTAETQKAEPDARPDQAAAPAPSPTPSPTTPQAAPPPESLNVKWAALVETLAPEDRPELPEGVQPDLVDSGMGELTLPLPGGATGSGETHTRHGWTMPDGKGSAIGVVRWTDSSWGQVKVDVGVGICPHRGKRLVSDVSTTGTAVAHHAATEPADDPNWFLHVNADANQEDKAGETLRYAWAVFTY